jgi:pimeloyl-ACP methyl ester carboxylesterase
MGDVKKLVQSGVLKAEATLRLPVYDIDVNGYPGYPPEVDNISFNGHQLSPNALTGDNGIWKLNLFKIPVEWINFPSDPGAGGTPTPVENTITINIDTASGSDENWCMSVDWVELKLDISAVPVVFIHGINSNGNTWGTSQLRNQVNELGLPNSGTEVNLGEGGSYESRLPTLAGNINGYKNRWGVKQLTLVGHSRGGLDSRTYLASPGGTESIAQVIQIATPNAGSPFADLPGAKLWHNASELSQDSLANFNQAHPFPSSVGLASIAGHSSIATDPNQSNCDDLAIPEALMMNSIKIPHDGIVPVASVYALAGIHLSEVASVTPGNQDSCHVKVHTVVETANKVLKYIKEPSGVAAAQKAKLNAASGTKAVIAANSGISYPLTFTLGGNEAKVVNGSTGNLNFSLPGSTSAKVLLSSEAATFTATFKKPDGSVVQPGSGISIESSPGLFGNATLLTLDAAHATAGVWTVSYSVSDAGSSNSSYLALVALEGESTLSGTFSQAPGILKAGRNGTVAVTLQDGSSPLKGAQATLKLASGDIALTETGSGIYSASVNFPAEGLYEGQVEVVYSGRTSYAGVSINVIQGKDAIGSPTADAGVSNPTNGLYDSLKVTVPITVDDAMHYRLTGTLRTSSGKTIDASAEADLSAGTGSIDLLFDGKSIYATGEDGPYTIENLILYSYSDQVFSKLIDAGAMTYTTSSYAVNAFQHDAVSIDSSKPVTSNAIDSNSDGMLDRIQVSIPVVSSNASNAYYEWTASLYDSEGIQVSQSANSGTVSPGDGSLTLEFDASQIGPNAMDEPFILGGFLLYGDSTLSLDTIAKINTPSINQFVGFVPCALTVNDVAFPDTILPAAAPSPQTLTVTNTGAARCVLTGSNVSSSDFTANTSTGFPVIMEAGAAITMSVELTNLSAGQHDASVTLSATGGQNAIATSMVSAKVISSANHAPVANDDTATTDYDTPTTISVLSNDVDDDKDTITISTVDSTSLQGSSIKDNGDGTVTYTPKARFVGVDSFSYSITDGNEGSDSATVSVTVNDLGKIFIAKTNVQPNVTVESNKIKISGLSAESKFSISGGEYSLNGSPYTKRARGTIKNGDIVQVRHTSSKQSKKSVTTTFILGKTKLKFTSTTLVFDISPESVSFTEATGVAPATLVESNIITVTGINVPIDISVTNGEYRINGGDYIKKAGVVKSGDTVQVSHKSSTRSARTVATTLKLARTEAIFESTTK